MLDLLILGTGAHAQEMAEIVQQVNHVSPRWRLLGYLGDAPAAAGPVELNGYRVLGAMQRLADYPDADVLLAYNVRPPAAARNPVRSLIAPSAFVSRSARIGPGSVIYPHGFVGAGAVLGARVFVLAACVVNHDDRLEDGVTLCSGVRLAGGVHVEAGAYLGQACTVRENVRVGAGSLVGMGSVVVADVPPHAVVAGNPARLLRWRQEPATAP